MSNRMLLYNIASFVNHLEVTSAVAYTQTE